MAQNVQLHYDFTKERRYFTSTVEQFKPDKWGSTFYFIDFDYDANKKNVSSAYMEISRNIKLGSFPVMAHVEFNGGLKHKVGEYGNGVNFDNCYLFGAAYATQVAGGNIEAQLMYKSITNAKEGPDFQATLVWGYPLLNGKLSFSGFIDFWTTDDFNNAGEADGKKLVILTEPQLWYNISKSFAAGSEVEISHNFIYGSEDVEIFPTIAVKYSF
jgi:hypothetical protein